MATDTATETASTAGAATKLKLDAPDALQPVAPAEASGLVPLKTEETTELDKRVAQFVDELAGLDSNSPEFGKKVDQLTAMGRKEIAEGRARPIASSTAGPRRSTAIPASAPT